MAANPTNAPLPQPPPINDRLAEFDSVPLFMKSLPTDNSDDVAISALQSIAYEGTPDEIAQSFKENGNEYFKGKRYREAMGFYTQGVDAQPTDIVLLEALLCNRAACNLELQNYGSVLRDCSKALTLNPRSSKALYRSALALIALDRAEEALDCCDRCLTFDQNNQSVLVLRRRAGEAKAAKDRKEKARLEGLEAEAQTKLRLHETFQERNLVSIPSPSRSEHPYEPHFDPDDAAHETVVFPVFFLYPQYGTSDVISGFVEDTSFAAHLSGMFPNSAVTPEWDQKDEYVDNQLVIYAITHRRRLLKVGKNMTLRDVFKASQAKQGEPRDGLEIKDGCLSFIVLPKGGVEQAWVADFKERR